MGISDDCLWCTFRFRVRTLLLMHAYNTKRNSSETLPIHTQDLRIILSDVYLSTREKKTPRR